MESRICLLRHRRLGRTDPTKTLKSNRKIKSLHTCHIKQKPSETQRSCGFSDANGMKLGRTAFLSVYDDLLDLRCLWNPASAFSVPFYPTYGTKLTPMGFTILSTPNRSLKIGMLWINYRTIGFYSKTRKYVYTLKSNNSVNTLARWRGFLTSPI